MRDEKSGVQTHDVHTPVVCLSDSSTMLLPVSWKYKRFSIFGYELPGLASRATSRSAFSSS